VAPSGQRQIASGGIRGRLQDSPPFWNLKDDGLMADPLAEQYADLLEGTYDCVDRIILNAYFPKGMNGGGISC